MSETDSGLLLDASLNHVHDLCLAGAAGHSEGHLVFVSIEHEVETRGADGEVPNLHSLKERR